MSNQWEATPDALILFCLYPVCTSLALGLGRVIYEVPKMCGAAVDEVVEVMLCLRGVFSEPTGLEMIHYSYLWTLDM